MPKSNCVKINNLGDVILQQIRALSSCSVKAGN